MVIRRAVLISFLCCFTISSFSLAQEANIPDDFIWKKDASSENEVASSRADSSFNFFDIGDLSYYSMYLVENDLRIISNAAGIAIERGPTKSSSIAIFHDTKVFDRLKNDKASFRSVGLSDNVLEMLEKKITTDDTKCVTMTIADGRNDVVNTIVLLSQKYDACLPFALLNSFGVSAPDINAKNLIDVCVLYEGRRRGVRDRQTLTEETPKLRDFCFTKAGLHE